MSVSGVKSSSSAGHARPRRWPRSRAGRAAPPRRRRRAWASPPCRRRRAAPRRPCPPSSRSGRRPHRRDVLVEALADLVGAEARARAPACGTRDALDELARAPVLLAVGDEEVLERQRAALVAAPQHERGAGAISAGGPSPIGEPLAMLPPMVPALRICTRGEAAQQLAEVGIVRRQRLPWRRCG